MWTVMYAFPDKVLTEAALQWQWHTKHKQASITTTQQWARREEKEQKYF